MCQAAERWRQDVHSAQHLRRRHEHPGRRACCTAETRSWAADQAMHWAHMVTGGYRAPARPAHTAAVHICLAQLSLVPGQHACAHACNLNPPQPHSEMRQCMRLMHPATPRHHRNVVQRLWPQWYPQARPRHLASWNMPRRRVALLCLRAEAATPAGCSAGLNTWRSSTRPSAPAALRGPSRPTPPPWPPSSR